MITIKDMEAMGWAYYNEKQDDLPISDMVKEFAKATGQAPSVNTSAKLIQEEYAEWFKDFTEFGVSVKELKELADLVYVIYGYANVRHWDLDEAVRRVHENNLGRCIQPDGTVKRREDGKIMKNPDYPSVVLDDLV
jgi:hypothetical protein